MDTGIVSPDISVLIATRDRANSLRRTLERLCQWRPSEVVVEIVVIDNNSTDHTRAVVEELAREYPVRYLFEAREGKNCALNAALDAGGLGRLVVFTDDDIDVAPDYLATVQAFSAAHPDAQVFGGRLESVWPGDEVPAWATHPAILGWGFPVLDLGNEPCEFPERRFPAGGNYWVRREMFDDGLRFEESIGPRPRNRIMGSETSLLKVLKDRGQRALYCPSAVVGHRIQPADLSPRAIRRRAFRSGRTSPHIWGLRHRRLLDRHRHLWRLLRVLSLVRYLVVTGVAFLHPGVNQRTVYTVGGIRGLAYNLEALRVERRAHGTGLTPA